MWLADIFFTDLALVPKRLIAPDLDFKGLTSPMEKILVDT